MFRRAVILPVVLALAGCATYRSELERGQRYYEENRFEHALAIWRVLEHDTDSLTERERSRYAYFRGMTDYRLGFREDARYWLGIAQAAEKQFPGGLNEDEQARLQKTLGDLNKDVFGIAPEFDDSASKATERSTLPDENAESDDAATDGSGGDTPPVETDTSPGESIPDGAGAAP